MNLLVSEENLPFFEALASSVRIEIIKCLSSKEMNIKELAEAVGISSAMMTAHVNKLEKAGLIVSHRTKKEGKVCMLLNQRYVLELPLNDYHQIQSYEVKIGVGQFTKAEVGPTCGLANNESIIGGYDDPRYFYDTNRFGAQLLWFTNGFVEYEIPNYIPDGYRILDIEISAEMSSEHPHIRNDWESDINLYLNDKLVCPWIAPGDFGDRKGKYTPSWWLSGQYGIFKKYLINQTGVFLDKEQKSEHTIKEFGMDRKHWNLRFEVSEEKRRAGGLTIFGERYGDYPYGIQVLVNYEKKE